MAVRDILLLGNPVLTSPCQQVELGELPDMRPVADDLHDTLLAFRARHGVGRGIAAPQIGVQKRLVVLDLAIGRIDLVNPRITERSAETFAIWDDCMSFPDLLVRVLRHRRCTIEYMDLAGASHQWRVDDENIAELLQHELDHLDGVLAVARAIDGHSFALRSQVAYLDGRTISQSV